MVIYVYHIVVQHNYTSNQVSAVREPAVELLPNRWVLDMYNTDVIIYEWMNEEMNEQIK